MSNLYPKIKAPDYNAPPPYNPSSDAPSAPPPPAEKPKKKKLIGFGSGVASAEAKQDEPPKVRRVLSYGYGQKVVKVPEQGHLQVQICKAQLDQYMRMHVLDDNNDNILQSPFVRIKCGDTALATWSVTKTKKNQLSPTWDDVFHWQIGRLTGTVLVLEVHDAESRTMMASTKIDLSSVLSGGLSTRKMYPLRPKGDVELEIKYQSKGFDVKSIHDNVYEDMDILGVKVSKYDEKCFHKPPLESLALTPGPGQKGATVTGVKGEAKAQNIKIGMKLMEINAKDIQSLAFWEITKTLSLAKEFPILINFE